MKLTITFEIEVSDIPEKEREGMIADGMDAEDMPRISDMSEDEVRAEIIDAFYATFDGADYDLQSEMWAGSDFYGYITGLTAVSAPTPVTNVGRIESEIASVIQSVNEWDDRTSPDDYPEHLLITSDELADILRNFAATLASPGATDKVASGGECRGGQTDQPLASNLSAHQLPTVWLPISHADNGIAYLHNLGELKIGCSYPTWVRDSDGRVYEALWSDDGKKAYWWDIEGESPVNPDEFMPHPLSATATGDR